MDSSDTRINSIKMQALSLPVGTTMRGECPRCSRKEMAITRTTQGLKFLCHRARCGYRGVTWSNEAPTQKTQQEVPEVQSTKLPDDVNQWLCQRYNLEPEVLTNEGVTWWQKRDRVLFPMRGLEGQRYGYTARAVKSGFTGPKSLNIVQDVSWPGGSFTRTSSDSPVLIVVEDPLSAYAAAEYGYRGLALLGVHLTEELEHSLLGFDEVVIALDEDATGKATHLVQRLGYLRVSQLPLPKDIKDMSLAERSAILGRW